MTRRLTNRRGKEIKKLAHRKHRGRQGEFLVEGVRAVEAAVEAGAPLTEVLVTEAARQEARVRQVLSRASVPVFIVSAREIERLSDVETSQGLLAVARTVWAPFEALLEARRVLVLDGVQDPGNVGTILRTAAWFGAEAAVRGPGTAGFHGPKVVRAAMGAHWDLALSRTKDLAAALRALQAAGFTLYGADLDGTAARAWNPRPPSALVLGSEAHGLSGAARALLDERVALPSSRPVGSGVESLNVAIAAGLLVYEWLGRS